MAFKSIGPAFNCAVQGVLVRGHGRLESLTLYDDMRVCTVAVAYPVRGIGEMVDEL